MRGCGALAPLFICFWLILLSFTAQSTFAQNTSQNKISGVVVDEEGEPVIGATVVFADKPGVGTITDIDGEFSLDAPINTKLKIASIGYESKIVVVNKNRLKIQLAGGAIEMKELVVTALGITREAKTLSYARQGVNTESMAEVRGTSVLDMLSGQAAGLHVASGGGPLASSGLTIRGFSTLTGNNQPLYVIDGVPIVNESGEDGDIDYGSIMNGISPDEIENIEILKGANAAALYGSDGAKGVILITTKKATKKEGLGVTYGLNMMFGTLYNYPTYQNIYGTGQNGRFQKGYNYYGYAAGALTFDPNLPYGIYSTNLAAANQRSWGLPMLGFDVVGRNGEVKSFSPGKNTIESLYETSTTITNSISFDKAGENHTFRFSYTNMDSDDILKNYNLFKRHNFALRATAKMTKFLSVDANVRYMYEDVKNRGYRGTSNKNPVFVIMSLPRDVTPEELTPWKNPDGTAISRDGFYNPYWLLNELSNQDQKHWLTGNVTFDLSLPYDLKMRLRAATDVQHTDKWSFINYYTPFDIDGYYSVGSSKTTNNTFDALLQYQKRISDISLSFDLGASNQSIDMKGVSSWVEQLIEPDNKSLSNNAGTMRSSEIYNRKKKQAVFGAASVGYKDWLYLDGTARNDWASTLPAANRSYFYYSLGTSLVISDLIDFDKNFISFAKLRASYADVGHDTNFDMLYSSFSYGGTFNGTPYYSGSAINKTPDLKPERTASWEIGGDIKFWNNRISIDATYYNKSTTDQIVTADAPLASGYRSRVINAGEIQNWGTELTLSVTPIKTKNFNWETSLNWARNNSLVVSLTDDITRFQLGSADKGTVVYAEVGKPYGVLYGNDYKRDENGNIYVSLAGVPKFEADQYLCNIQPDWFGGWRNTFQYKDFSFGVMLDFQKGGNVWSYTAYRGGIDGNTVQSLGGRKDYEFSVLVLGESDDEIRGLMTPGNTVQKGADYYGNHVLYPDGSRPKGVQIGGTVYDPSEDYWGGQPSNAWVAPMSHWTHNNGTSMRNYIYDASYIKLREVSLAYRVPKKWLKKTPFGSASLSLVGRNVAILHQNTPRGVDPQATATVGNGRGFERSYSLPMATWGFDLKISF